MYNNNIFDIIVNNWNIIISTWINWKYWKIFIDIDYNELNNLLLDKFRLNIWEFIEKSREKWNFIIEKYNWNKQELNKWVYLSKNNLLILKI